MKRVEHLLSKTGASDGQLESFEFFVVPFAVRQHLYCELATYGVNRNSDKLRNQGWFAAERIGNGEDCCHILEHLPIFSVMCMDMSVQHEQP